MIKKVAEINFKTNADEVKSKVDSLNNSLGQTTTDKASDSVNKLIKNTDKLEKSNKGLFKSTLDNGGAMGLLNDLTGGLAMTIKDTVEASDLFQGSMKGWKAALAASGVGLLVIALGAIVAYWDDIKGAVDGVSSSQKKLLETQKEATADSESKLDTLNNQDNILKQQGKSERQILKIKAAQTAEVIKNVEIQLQQEKAQLKAQVAAAKRNQEILSGMLNWLNIPLRLVLGAIDGVGEALGLNFGLVDGLEAKTKSIRDKAAGLIFDPEKVASEGEKTIGETEKKLNDLKNQKAGFELGVKEIDAKAASDKKAKQKEIDDKEAADKKKNDDAYIAEEKKLRDSLKDVQDVSEQQKLDTQKARELEEINNLKGKTETEKQVLRDLLDAKYKILQDKLDKENKLKEEQRQKDIQALVNGNVIEKSITDAKNLDELNTIYLHAQEKLKNKQAEELQKAIDLGANETQINALKEGFRQQDLALEQQNTDAKKKIGDLEQEDQKKKVAAIGQTLQTASQLLGEHTVAGKALAIAATTISTYQSAVQSYKGMVEAIPGPVGIAAGAVAAAASVASGLATVKKIIATKVPGASGGGAAGASTPSAPAKPSVSFQNTAQSQISDTIQSSAKERNSQPVKAYVTVGDINSAQSLDRQVTTGAKF